MKKRFSVNFISNNKQKYDGFEFVGTLEELLNEVLSKHREISEVYEVVVEDDIEE